MEAGTNTLEVTEVNAWEIRLVGDAQSGAVPVTNMKHKAKDALQPSGLLGSVTLDYAEVGKLEINESLRSNIR